MDPEIRVTRGRDMSFTLSARGGVAAWTWLDHPAGTVGYFVDKQTNVPTNGFYLIPGIDRTGTLLLSLLVVFELTSVVPQWSSSKT